MDNCEVIDITYIIEQRKIKRDIHKQLVDLGIVDHFNVECKVKFSDNGPKYVAYIWDKYSGEHLYLNSDLCVTKALIDRVI